MVLGDRAVAIEVVAVYQRQDFGHDLAGTAVHVADQFAVAGKDHQVGEFAQFGRLAIGA